MLNETVHICRLRKSALNSNISTNLIIFWGLSRGPDGLICQNQSRPKNLMQEWATARYFYGSILLRALKSKITIVLAYVSEI